MDGAGVGATRIHARRGRLLCPLRYASADGVGHRTGSTRGQGSSHLLPMRARGNRLKVSGSQGLGVSRLQRIPGQTLLLADGHQESRQRQRDHWNSFGYLREGPSRCQEYKQRQSDSGRPRPRGGAKEAIGSRPSPSRST